MRRRSRIVLGIVLLSGALCSGVFFSAAPAAQASADCSSSSGSLEWGFKDTFRSYISGTIAQGSWQAADGASYRTPQFSWPLQNSHFNAAKATGALRFQGSVNFSGHEGVLSTTIADPTLVLNGKTTALLKLDVRGATMADALAGHSERVQVAQQVKFARLDLRRAEIAGDARSGKITLRNVPAELSSAGSAAFPNYPAGAAFDPLNISFSTSPACAATLLKTLAPGPGPWVWVSCSAGLVVLAGAAVLLLRKRARRRAAKSALAATALSLSALLFFSACAPQGEQAPDAAKSAPQKAPTPLSEITNWPDPHSIEGGSTATLATNAVMQVVENPAQQLPVTVTSHEQGGPRQVTITDTSRVIAIDLAGTLAATVWGLGFGDTLVGRDQSSTFAGVKKLPQVTAGGHTINHEAVINLQPTLVITDGTIGPRDVVEQLRDVGITVVFVENTPSFAGAEKLAQTIANIYGAPAAGAQLAAWTTQQVNDTIADIARIAPQDPDKRLRILFLYLRGAEGVYYLFGKDSGADDLITGLGAIDIASEQGWRGKKPMTDEALVAANPDLILVMSGGLQSVGGVKGLLREKPAIAITTAGERRRFVDMDDGTILSFGPRSAQVLAALARAIYLPQERS